MADGSEKLDDFGVGNGILLINGHKFTGYGESENPVSSTAGDAKNGIKRGYGGSALKFSRANEGRGLRVSLLPGHSDNSIINGWYLRNATVEAQWVFPGTSEKIIISGGVVSQLDELGRFGGSPSDNNWIFEFNKFLPAL